MAGRCCSSALSASAARRGTWRSRCTCASCRILTPSCPIVHIAAALGQVGPAYELFAEGFTHKPGQD